MFLWDAIHYNFLLNIGFKYLLAIKNHVNGVSQPSLFRMMFLRYMVFGNHVGIYVILREIESKRYCFHALKKNHLYTD